MLPIAERELRVAARQPRTYRARLGMAGVGVLIFGWTVWLIWWHGRGVSGPDLFEALAWIAFVYCLIAGVTLTSDSLSSEKRENTIGLLFLTDLKGHDIVIGKLMANSLNCFLGLLALFPVLAIPLMMGGVQLSDFGRVALNLCNTLLFSLSAGLLVSTLSKRALGAASFALGFMAFAGFGLYGFSELLRVYYQAPEWAHVVELACPFYTQLQALRGSAWALQDYFWWSVLTVLGLSFVCLALACWILPKVWQERPGGRKTFRWRERWRRWKFGADHAGRGRRRLLDLNPFYWLGARERLSVYGSLLFIVGLASLGIWIGWRVGPNFGGSARPYGGLVFVWFWTTASLHGILLFRVATYAAHRFVEDRRSGALELLLSTPLPARQIWRGQWLALIRQLWGPMCAALLAHGVFVWGLLELFAAEELSPAKTAWDIIKSAFAYGLSGLPGIDWHFLFVFIVVMAIGILLAIHWITLGWVGMWMGLKVKHARIAPWLTLALVLIPPWPIFIFFVAAMDYINFFWSEFELLYLCLAVGFGLGLAHNVALSIWAWRRLSRDFRVAVTDRFLFLQRKRSWRQRGRIVVRFALVGASALAIGWLWHFEENWRGERAWSQFQQALAVAGETLDLASLSSEPVPLDQNFAAAPIFRPLFDFETIAPGVQRWRQTDKLSKLQSINLDGRPGGWWASRYSQFGNWQAQQVTDLKACQKHFKSLAQFPTSAQTNDPAGEVLRALSKFEPELAAIRVAKARPHAQLPFNLAQLQSAPRFYVSVFQGIGGVLQLRAVAELHQNRPSEAFEDLELIFRLAATLRTEPVMETQRAAHALLGSAFQVIWEGLAERHWPAEQLAAMQGLLQSFTPLADCPKVMRVETLLQIAAWDRFRSVLAGARVPLANPREERWKRLRWFYPAGRTYRHQIEIYHLYRDQLMPMVDAGQGRAFLETTEAASIALEKSSAFLNHNAVRYNFENFAFEFAQHQTWVNQAILACALERYWLARGQYPETLDALVPEYVTQLPRDAISGGIPAHRRTSNGRFTLSSEVHLTRRGQEFVHRWTWAYPVKK
ncbi:MAG: ABC transporter permease subunit [Verrucomicrobia bacterium]|nr:ABC transporter permease subunit [Verrucomicrobiota bacterium]